MFIIQESIVNVIAIAGELNDIDHNRVPSIKTHVKMLYHQNVENADGYDETRVSELSSVLVGLEYRIAQVKTISVGVASFDHGPTRNFFGTQSKCPFRLPSGTRIHGCLGSVNEESVMGGSFRVSDSLLSLCDGETDDSRISSAMVYLF